jgi:hypothetical protein
MIRLAEEFSAHKKEKHGDSPVLLICDDLKPHLSPEVKKIVSPAQVFLFCLPPNITESLQPLDTVFGRCLCLAVGRLLDEWLMAAENHEKWEGKMTAGERGMC